MIITCKEYNNIQSVKYHEAWKQLTDMSRGCPQIAFYFFWDKRGNKRTTGFVKIEGQSHQWAKTKKELLK